MNEVMNQNLMEFSKCLLDVEKLSRHWVMTDPQKKAVCQKDGFHLTPLLQGVFLP